SACLPSRYFLVFFFFQAEDGIRDGHVTGVQTCALPIWFSAQGQEQGMNLYLRQDVPAGTLVAVNVSGTAPAGSAAVGTDQGQQRSEERRVGKECRARE